VPCWLLLLAVFWWGSTGFRPRCLPWWTRRQAWPRRRLLLCKLPPPKLRLQSPVRRLARLLFHRHLPHLQGLPLPQRPELPRRQRRRSLRPNRRRAAMWTPALRPTVRSLGPTAPISRATGRGGFAQNRSPRLNFGGSVRGTPGTGAIRPAFGLSATPHAGPNHAIPRLPDYPYGFGQHRAARSPLAHHPAAAAKGGCAGVRATAASQGGGSECGAQPHLSEETGTCPANVGGCQHHR